MWTLEAPGYLFLLIFIPFGVYFRHLYPRRGGRLPFSVSVWRGDRVISGQRTMKALLFLGEISFWAGVVLLVIALSSPSLSTREKVFLNRGIDIMIVLDESPSMSAQDFQPKNRFETAKQVIREFVKNRENDAVGLVSFSREAALRSPPTFDTEAFLQRLDGLRIMSLGDGTAIGMGIAVAALHLQQSTAQQGIIIILTDGENNAGEILPESAAEIAASLGLRIYVIGIGTQGEVPIEFVDPDTGKVNKGMFNSKFNERLLEEIAESADGRYFSAKSPGALNAVFRTIDSIETTEKRSKIQIRTSSRYHLFALIGLACVFFEFFIRKGLYREVL